MERRLSRSQLVAAEKETPGLDYASWVEIDLDALAHNLTALKKQTKALICPVLKGDAYGHGAPVLAAFFQARGCPLLAVGTVQEALLILELVKARLLVLTPPLSRQLPLVFKHALIPAITSLPLLAQLGELAQERKQRVSLHLKVDTGLGRLGLDPQQIPAAAQIMEKNPFLKLEGVFTHFAGASQNKRLTNEQLQQLLQLRGSFAGQRLLWHAANSAAFLHLPASHLDLARIGTLLYGQSPLPWAGASHLRPTWSFHTRLIQIKTVPPGQNIGYGTGFRTKRATTVGVIPVGYSDGLQVEPQTSCWRQLKQIGGAALRQKGKVFLPGNVPLPILGRVAMSTTCLDLTPFPHLEVGDRLLVAMRRVTAKSSLPKLYLQEGRLRCYFWNGAIYAPNGVRTHLRGLF